MGSYSVGAGWGPLAAEPADEEAGGDDAVAGDAGREGVGAEGVADGARGPLADGERERFVGRHPSGGDLARVVVHRPVVLGDALGGWVDVSGRWVVTVSLRCTHLSRGRAVGGSFGGCDGVGDVRVSGGGDVVDGSYVVLVGLFDALGVGRDVGIRFFQRSKGWHGGGAQGGAGPATHSPRFTKIE